MSFILLRKLYQLQIVQGQDYINSFQSRTTKTRVIKSARGKIYDRNGDLIASNVLSWSLTLEDNGSYESTRQKNLALNGIAYRIIKILEKNGDELSHNFHIRVGKDGEYEFDISPGFTLSRFKADIYGQALIDDLLPEQRRATAPEMIDYLCSIDRFRIIMEDELAYTDQELENAHLPRELSKEDILKICIIRYLLSTNSFKKYMPVTIATGLSEKSVAALMENSATLTGIDIVEDSSRKYVDEISMGPILGYTGKASAEELTELRKKNPDYSNDAVIGKSGIEQYMELTLQGTDGRETVTVDNLGKVLRIDPETQVDPIAGNDVQLTIDTRLQSGIYEILKQRVAGIMLNRISAEKEFDYDAIIDSAQIEIPIYDVYNMLVENSVIDIRHFYSEDASPVEQALYEKFQQKQEQVFAQVRDRLTADNPPAQKDESEEMQAYLSYICDSLLTNTLEVISSDAVDTMDATYKAWNNDQTISLKEYLTYAASQNWLDISGVSPVGDYLDSQQVYALLTDYTIEELGTDYGFSKLLYKYMLLEDTITGEELCLVLYEQGVLDKEDEDYESLASGAVGAYDFMVKKIANLEIEPSQLALMPCSASCVVVDLHNGDTVACVSYPGYDSNRLANNMDTDYYASLALDLSSPFFNKATQQTTAPGSTMKLLSTITGMQEGVINENTLFECTGSFDLVQPPIACWNTYGHGSIDVRTALQESCNYFFNMVGFLLGRVGDDQFSENQSLRAIQKWAAQLGLDKKTGIQINEASPHVSDSLAVPSYMGQGTHLYTTTQLARYASVIGNRGTVYQLTLLDKVISPEGKVIEEFEPMVINRMDDVSDSVWQVLEDGMTRVVKTHSQFNNVNMDFCAKTGTAQVDLYHPDHGVVLGYAPTYDPQYAFAIRVPNGYGSGNACLVAADVLMYVFNLADPDRIITGYAASDVSNTSND
ncbi:MAG: peptidase [Blautia sp.]|nr:peptidase [Blautia sp.]